MARMYEPRAYRICKLADCETWRVETLQRPRWFGFWLTPRWIPVRLFSVFDFMGGPRDAEYRTRLDAVAAVEGFERSDLERRRRREDRWECGRAEGS